jgi:hypothetical protein
MVGIDSVIKKIDDQKYARRFTPRRPGSIWSKSNISKMQKLLKDGKVTRQAREAFQEKTRQHSLEGLAEE